MPEPIQPVQKRSRQSLDEIVNAVERLLETHGFAEITVAQIAAEAGVSAGLLYTRFGGKEELLDYVVQEFVREQRAAVAEALVVHEGEQPGIEERVDRLIDYLASFSVARRGLVRAAAGRRLLRPATMSEEEVGLTREIRAVALEWLLDGRPNVLRDPADAALSFTNYVLFLVVQIGTVLETDPDRLAALLENLKLSMVAYLRSSGPARG